MNKLNGKIMLPVGLISVLGLSIFSWGSLQGQVKSNTVAISKVEETPLKIAVMQNDIEYLKTGQTEMKQTLKAILRAINGE